jgi:RalA-binding protein 1
VRRLAELVRELPKVNYEVLQVLSKHLKRIVQRSQENKMTIRNGKSRCQLANYSVGIVFSPTLNIPAPVFSLFITEFAVVFDEPDDTPITVTPPAAQDSPSYDSYNSPPQPTSQPVTHRRNRSFDPVRSTLVYPPPSPFHPNHSSHLQPAFQQPYQQLSYPQYQSQQSTYPQNRWDNPQEDSNDLFGW